MSTQTVGTVDSRARRTLLLGTRLALAANTTLQLSFLFAYLYLRANNFNGGWRPDGITDLPSTGMAIALLLQLVCLGAAVVAAATARRGRSARMLALVALLFALGALVVRWLYQYNLGDNWTIANGTYVATTMLWFSVLILEVLLGAVWLLAIVAPSTRARSVESSATHLRAFSEYWGYVLVLSTLVWLLARLV